MALTEFLLDRIAEDKADAQAALDDVEHEADLWMSYAVSDNAYPSVSDHVQKWTPSRVLAECEAKRRIVEWLPEDDVLGDGWHDGWNHGHRYAMQLLALPYADHPDYQQDWRP
jgi:hypothetical protein